MKKFTTQMIGRGSVLTILLLSLSLIFTACSDGGDDPISNPSPTLPENKGENPVTEILGDGTTSIRLKVSDYSDNILVLHADGTATMGDEDTNTQTPYYEFSYTYNASTKEIYMKMEKTMNDMREDYTLCTYDELVSQTNADFEINNFKKLLKENFDKNKNEEWFKEDYPNCNSYEAYEAAFIKEGGYKTLDELVSVEKKTMLTHYYRDFSSQVTYNYKKNRYR